MRRRLGICFILRLGVVWAFFTTNSLFTAVWCVLVMSAQIFCLKSKRKKMTLKSNLKNLQDERTKMRDLKERLNLEREFEREI